MAINKSEEPRFFNLPNSLTIFRYAMIILSWALKLEHRFMFLSIILYSISCLMDMCDGYLARKFNQRTVVGSILDQIVDRASTITSCLDVVMAFPEYKFAVYLWMIIDIFGHWTHCYSCCYIGNIDHKSISRGNIILRQYYTCRPLMFTSIVCTETFWISAYWYKEKPYYLNNLAGKLMIGVLPLALFRTVACVCQGYYGMRQILDHERKLYNK